MDIKVTFPKEPANEERLVPNLQHFRNLPNKYSLYFKIGKCPIEGSVIFGKDRAYFGWNNHFWGSCIIKDIRAVYSEEANELSNWDGTAGNFIISDADTWEELPEPLHYERGFPSFQYWNK